MYKKPSPSRLSYIFTIIAWNIILASSVIFFDQIENIGNWTPKWLARIDNIRIIVTNLCVAALIGSVIAWIFREIRHSEAIENIIVRRFLPIIRFLITASVWLITVFHILEKLNIDTRSILTWAWIWWAIIALAGKDIMTNLFGSLSILLGRVFDIGETIRVRGSKTTYEGIVEEITLNYTKLTHLTGEVVYIPNRTIYTETIENLSRQRYETYTYLVPFAKGTSKGSDIRERMRIIEGKLSEYDPLSVEWEMENPNAWDYMYRIIVKFPEENDAIDRDIRMYLTEHIFRG
jgi:small-conductance mechanosensitive channel